MRHVWFISFMVFIFTNKEKLQMMKSNRQSKTNYFELEPVAENEKQS